MSGIASSLPRLRRSVPVASPNTVVRRPYPSFSIVLLRDVDSFGREQQGRGASPALLRRMPAQIEAPSSATERVFPAIDVVLDEDGSDATQQESEAPRGSVGVSPSLSGRTKQVDSRSEQSSDDDSGACCGAVRLARRVVGCVRAFTRTM